MCDIEESAKRAQATLGGYAPQPPKPDAAKSARDLARLMERQLGYHEGHFDPIALRLFIRAYWSRVSKYAHIIHDEESA